MNNQLRYPTTFGPAKIAPLPQTYLYHTYCAASQVVANVGAASLVFPWKCIHVSNAASATKVTITKKGLKVRQQISPSHSLCEATLHSGKVICKSRGPASCGAVCSAAGGPPARRRAVSGICARWQAGMAFFTSRLPSVPDCSFCSFPVSVPKRSAGLLLFISFSFGVVPPPPPRPI